MMQFTVKGKSFDSPYSDNEVRDKLAQLVNDDKVRGQFPKDLLDGFANYGNWTERQRPWAHKFVHDAENPAPPASKLPGFKTIVDHLRRCRERRDAGGAGLLNPMVRVELSGVKFTLKLAGPKSKNYGKVSVAESHRFGEGTFYGWIDENGGFDRYRGCTNDVLALLQRIASDPASQINEIGKESGRCCYCWAELSQVQSKIAGCGKTCADNYGVPYPRAAETRAFIAEHPEVLVGATDAGKWS
jgi:hypothetical protein